MVTTASTVCKCPVFPVLSCRTCFDRLLRCVSRLEQIKKAADWQAWHLLLDLGDHRLDPTRLEELDAGLGKMQARMRFAGKAIDRLIVEDAG